MKLYKLSLALFLGLGAMGMTSCEDKLELTNRVIWECELKPAVMEKTLESLAFTLNHIFLEDHHIRRYELPEEKPAMVAEPEPRHRD